MIVGDKVEVEGVVYQVRYWDAFEKNWVLEAENVGSDTAETLLDDAYRIMKTHERVYGVGPRRQDFNNRFGKFKSRQLKMKEKQYD